MNMNMNNLYTILKGLDEEDVAYTVSVNGGPRHRRYLSGA